METKSSLNPAGEDLSPEQIEYFKNSKARDENGNLLKLYHGTSNAGFAVFDPKKGRSGCNWFTTSRRDADSYGGNPDGKLFDPNERYSETESVGGNFMIGSQFCFDSEADREAFLKEYPEAKDFKTSEEYQDLMDKAEDDEDWDLYDRLERESEDYNTQTRLKRAYRRANDARKAELLEDIKSKVLESTKDKFFAWLRESGVRNTPKLKKGEYRNANN